MKKLFYLINAKVLFLLMLMTVLFTACSEQDSKLRAANSSANNTWVESDAVSVTPIYTPVDLNDLNQYLGTAAGDYIYAEDVPHSDFWRISANFNTGGRPNTDRLVRGKETALGNLFAISWRDNF